ncbi:2-oxoglutarate dehydrogenase, E2 component, dihydrolipoamide succinyltransferase [Streptomyces violaceorubidus]
MDSEKGLMTPVIKNAGDLNLAGIAKATADLAGKAAGRKSRRTTVRRDVHDLQHRFARRAVRHDHRAARPGRHPRHRGHVKRPVVTTEDGGQGLGIRDMAYLTLSYDHRLVDGADTARYLTAVKAILEAGEFEVELGL